MKLSFDGKEEDSIGRRQSLFRLASAVAIGASFASESNAKSSLVGENPKAAEDLFNAKWQNGINKRTQRLFGCQTQVHICFRARYAMSDTDFE